MLTTSVVATVTTAIAFSTTSTVESSVAVYVLANPLAELAVLIGAIASILSIAFVIKVRTGAKSIMCPNCGHMNPPHASKFCVNCGKPLRNDPKV
ncbi:MAG TPA: zinc ribbon domain-containing protein [Candidatus Acidoferrum sp.]|nr:zinc ribbon domain-containing protein [Candidatus Acidoferrum sp.]